MTDARPLVLTSLFLILGFGACQAPPEASNPEDQPPVVTLTPNELAASCDGTSGEWAGCRGSGCWVCSELVKDYPSYFLNHANCSPNDTCGGAYYTCSASCPAPTAADRAIPLCQYGANFAVSKTSTGLARDIAATPSEVFVLGTTPVSNGYNVYKRVLSSWSNVGGAGVRLGATATTMPVVVGANNALSVRQFTWSALPAGYGPVSDVGGSVTSLDIVASGTPYYLVGGLGLGHGTQSWLQLGTGLTDGRSISVFGNSSSVLGNAHWAITATNRVAYLDPQGQWVSWADFPEAVVDIAAAGTVGTDTTQFAFIATGATPAGSKVYRISRGQRCLSPLYNSVSRTQIVATRLTAVSPTRFWFIDAADYIYSASQQ